MNRLKQSAALVVAVLLGMGIGSLRADAASVGVLVSCTDVQLQGANFVFACQNAPGDSSGIGLQMTITAPTNRYPLGVPATITLP